MKLKIATALLAMTIMTCPALDLNQRRVEYETNPGANQVEYTAETADRGAFDLVLKATEAFGGQTQRSRGTYRIKTEGKWTDIIHTTTDGITFTIRIDGGSQTNTRTGINVRGNVLDGRGNPALAGETPFEFEFKDTEKRIQGTEPVLFNREATQNQELQFQIRETKEGKVLQAVNPITGKLWWEKQIGSGGKTRIKSSPEGDLLAVMSGEDPGTGQLPRLNGKHNTLYILDGKTGKIRGKMNPLSEKEETAWGDTAWQDIKVDFRDNNVVLRGTLKKDGRGVSTPYLETIALPDWEKR